MNRLNLLKNMLYESPNDAFVLFAIAKEEQKLGNLDQALDYYSKLTESDLAYVGAYYHHAQLLSQLNQHGKAVEILDAGIAVAKKAGDRHSLSELMELRMGYDD